MADPGAGRLVSLDVLRGMTVALMILVNNAGDGAVSYGQLRHSVWNGCTLTDVVFPTFLFIVGASVALALGRKLARGVSRWTILAQGMRRTLLIAAIGLALNALPYFHLSELRYYGVLQRIALCYLLASLVYVAGGVRACAAMAVLTLAGYWWAMTRIPVPGYGMPGVNVGVLDRAGNMASWLDRAIVPAPHLYHQSNYDPEGLLSTVPALGTTLLGVLAVAWLASARSARAKAAGLAASGLVLIAAGLLWAHSFPLNKRLWTSSYALFTAGIAMLALAGLYWMIDGRKARRGLDFWLVFGTNALTAYVLSEVLQVVVSGVRLPGGESVQRYSYLLLLGWLGPPGVVSVVYSVLFVLVCFVPVWMLYRKGIFVKL